MEFIEIVYLFLLTIPVFFVIDMVWLGFVARGLYKKHIGFLLGPVNWVAAVIFYLLFIVGILVFAVLPALAAGSLTHVILLGTFFGFITYATYDLTNLATIKDWPITITVIDMIWGSVLSGSVAIISFLIGSYLFL